MPRILLAEDDAPLRDALQEALVAQGFEVCVAADAEEAAGHVATQLFDAVVSDVDMPGNGHTLLEMVRTSRPGTPVILITGIEEWDGRERAAAEGAYEYLVKPIGLRVLKSTLDRACRQPKPPTGA